MIELYCQHCGHHLKIPDKYAGQSGTCKNCGKQIVVPVVGFEPDPAPAPIQKTKDIPYKWIGATAAVMALLAIGIYSFVSRDDTPLPPATSSEVVTAKYPETSKPNTDPPEAEARIQPRTVVFPEDRSVGRVMMRDRGGPNTFGSNIGPAQGPVMVPEGQEVGLFVNNFHPGDIAFLEAFGPNELDYLMLVHAALTDDDVKYIEHLSGLKFLLFEYCDLSDVGLRSFRGFVNLEFLGLGGTKITDDGLATLSSLTRLEGLSVGGTRITERGIRSLKSLPLKTIMLNGFTLTPAMMDVLKEFPGLTMMRIDSGRPDDADRIPGGDRPTSLESILMLRQITQLQTLVLDGKLHNDSLIPALSQLTHLKKIEFWGTSVTAAGRDELRRLLPNCTIP